MTLNFFYLSLLIGFLIYTIIMYEVDEKTARLVSFIFSLIIFINSIWLFFFFDFSINSIEVLYINLFNITNLNYIIGLDFLSLIFLLLTTFLIPLCILAGWNSIKFKLKFFYFLILIIEFFLINVFLTFDLFFFYFWFESILIPMFFLIGIWGKNSRKINAVYYFFILTVIGSIFFLISIIYIYINFNTTNIFQLIFLNNFNNKQQLYLWLSFFLAFAVKVPIFPFHIWLPEAHVEAPTVGSMILAGLLLKIGYYGIIRFFLPFFPFANYYFLPLVNTLCIMGLIYGSFLALSQLDLKKIIAYSSVAHMNLSIIGIFSLNTSGLIGSCLISVGHGFVSTSLFFLIGCLYDRYHTRLIDYYGGLINLMPIFSIFFFYFSLSNFAFPITLNFIGEVLIIFSISQSNYIILFFVLLYSIISVAYSLLLYTKLCFGTLKINNYNNLYIDLSKLEILILFPMFFFSLYFCFFPSLIINCLSTFFSFYTNYY